jgi:hypothetical protein
METGTPTEQGGGGSTVTIAGRREVQKIFGTRQSIRITRAIVKWKQETKELR